MKRLERAKAAQALRPSKRAEEGYVRDLRAIMVEAVAPGRRDAKSDVGDKVGFAFDRMVSLVKKKHVIGVHPGILSPVIAAARERNIALMEKATAEFKEEIEGVTAANFGTRVEDLAELIADRVDVSKSRAELIARDQTLKTNGAINQAKQQAAGVSQYTWSTSHDDRVRPDHARLDGEVITWGNPPVTNEETGDTNDPGQDFQCRCIAIPVIDLEG